MKKLLATVLALTVTVSSLSLTSFAAEEPQPNTPTHYSYVDLVDDLVNMEDIAVLPLPGEVGEAATSYDRASKYNAETDKYINWNANGDGGGYIRQEDGGIVAADLTGPGVIYRSWSALAQSGIVDIYIDGATEPIVHQSFDSFFKPQGRFNGLDQLCYTTEAQGRNNFVPISYNESCKIILRNGWGNYFQFSYKEFPEGTTVESYPDEFSQEQMDALKDVNDYIKNGMGTRYAAPVAGEQAIQQDYTIPAGGSVPVIEASGTGALTQFKVRVNDNLTYEEMWDAVQELTVSMYWDGEEAPSVWAPLGDFFGSTAGDFYLTVPAGVDQDGWFYCYWYMPFADGAKVVIGNDGLNDKNISIDAITAPLTKDINTLGRFHAKWNKDEKPLNRSDRNIDYTVLETQGSGRFLGFCLHVWEKGNFGWWGEGDEKFHVDGEKFPSTFGTGSEDYFGYAWCDANIFNQRPFHAQNHTSGKVGAKGNYCNVRYQISENVPFQTEFAAYFEKYYPQEQVEFAVTPYWYLAADGVDDYVAKPLSVRTGWYEKIKTMETTLQAESLDFTATNGTAAIDGGQVIFKGEGVDSAIEFSFTLKNSLNAELKLLPTRTPDSGIFQFYLDDVAIGGPVDLYLAQKFTTNYINLGKQNLARGAHTIKAVAVGQNEAATGYRLGLDLVRLDETPGPATYQLIEGEDMLVTSLTGRGSLQVQDIGSLFATGKWSKDRHIWWTGGNVGDEMKLEFTLAEDFNGPVKVNVAKAVDYGNFQMFIDDVAVTEEVNCYDTKVTNQWVDLGKLALAAGKHEVKVVITGKDNRATGYMFGIDAMTFSPHDDNVLFLDDVAGVSGKEGTQFNVPVQISSFPIDGAYQAIEGVVQLPEGVKVAEITPSDYITYDTFDYDVDAQGKLRFAFVSTDGSAIQFAMDRSFQLLNIKLELTSQWEENGSVSVAFDSFAVKNRNNTVAYDVEQAVSNIEIIGAPILSVIVNELYAGDGLDLIPADKKAISVQFVNLEGEFDISLNGKQLYYSAEKSAVTLNPTYVALIDADVDISALSVESFTYGEAAKQEIQFGDTDENGTINAQDALNVLTAWLRKSDAPADKGILVMNVSADARIDTSDCISIVDNYVNGIAFPVVEK